MKYIKILEAFEIEINKIDDVINKPSVDDSLYWLNQAVAKFVKIRFNGDPVHNTSYEETEKRRHDLIKLFSSKIYDSENIQYIDNQVNYDKYMIEYPNDFLYVLNENVIIAGLDGSNQLDTCVFECTQDSYMYRINNSLTDFHYNHHRARPLRIRNANGCDLLTDKKYKIVQYTLGYIRKPNEITLENPHDEYNDFEDSIIYEIVKIAAQMYIENKSDKRYTTISNEVNTQE